eukprot:Rhum_TRINITY_DN14684_c0_g1::Rhum_TRINITY_DN14684_c0_g1_i1::g.107658::m.107658/K10408/DNAH; dynein heavy chain, axonemal
MGKGRGAESKEDERQTDKRVTWLENRMAVAMKLKPADLRKITDQEDNAQAIKEFFDTADTRALFVVSKNGVTCITTDANLPTEHKKKIFYFMKMGESGKTQKVDLGNINKTLVFGDLHVKPLDTLDQYSRNVFLPVVKNTANIEQIPEVAQPAFMENVNTYLANVLVTNGLCGGRTLLPLPPIEFPDRVDEPTRDKDLLYQLESVIVAWTAQVKSAIQQSPESMLQHGNPGPKEELEFWRNKRDNLLSLEDQLHTPKVLKVIVMLNKAGSSYYKPFSELVKELRKAAEEACDNFRYLEPLRECFFDIADAQDSESFAALVENGTFKKLFHYVYVVWTNSRHYNTPTRLVILMREVCNDLINSAKANVSVDDLFQCEPEEAMKRLSGTLSVCSHFKTWYFFYKNKAGKEEVDGELGKPRPWKFQNTTLFARLDSFLERCHDLLDVLETVILFNRLERVEIGGTHGAELSANIAHIHKEFQDAYQQFHTPNEGSYDILDVDEPRFDPDFTAFRSDVRKMEMRLGCMLTQSMEDSGALYNSFKLVDTYEGFLDRNVIHQEWQKRQGDVLLAYHGDLLQVQECFLSFREDTTAKLTVYNRMPQTSAQLIFAKGLLERVAEPYARITELSKQVMQSELAIETLNLHKQLSANLRAYVHSVADKWASQVGATSSEKLKLNLLYVAGGQMHVNFDDELDKLLRDISYLQLLNSYDTQDEKLVVPPHASSLYKRRDQFRSQRLKLGAIVTTYNTYTATMLEVEKPMLVAELQQFEYELMRGVNRLNWNSPDIDEFIETTVTNVTALDTVLHAISANLKKMTDLLAEYTAADKFLPLHAKDHKTLSLDEFLRKYEGNREVRQQALMQIGVEIHELLAASLDCINRLKKQQGLPLLDTDTECWVNYVGHCNTLVSDAITLSVVRSLENLRCQLSADWLKENDGIPLLDVKLILDRARDTPQTAFVPHMMEGPGSLNDVVNSWMQDYVETAQCITRLDTLPGSEESYVEDVKRSERVVALHTEINTLLAANMNVHKGFEAQFVAFSGLWSSDMEKCFRHFICVPQKDADPASAAAAASSGAGAGAAGAADAKGNSTNGQPQTPAAPQENPEEEFFGVPLELFDQKISQYKRITQQIGNLPTTTTLGWLRTDCKPIIISLKEYCRDWVSMYTGYVVDRIGSSLRELFDFMRQADEGLDEAVTDNEDDEAALRRVLKHIRDCKVRDAQVKAMFEPILRGILILRSHGSAVDEKVLQQLEDMRRDAPDQWKDLDKKYRTIRKDNNARQEAQGDKLKYKALAMEEEVQKFRGTFKNLRPFHYQGITVEEAYSELVTWNSHLCEREQEAEELNELLELFEKQTTDLPELKECRQELILLKQLWDMVSHVKSQFTDWWSQTFKTMCAEELISRTRDMLKQMKAMPLKCKVTGTFVGLESEIKSMLVTLPLVENLRNPAMRERHWKQLLKRCAVDSTAVDPESDDFSLQDLLSLQLHRCEEDVANIVEKAQKELQIEKGLEKVLKYWEEEARFEYVWHEGLNCYLLGPIDDIVEVLEENLNSLQAMMSNRFVEEFSEQVARWQRNLGTVETCMTKWVELQKMWMNLHPIFIESVDIREQLQEDSRAFQGADDLYRALMGKACKYTSVIEVCCTDVIQRKLERDDDFETLLGTIEDTLVTCQKKLREYLEGKKKLFARFFFLSNTDLIDILSKGSDPVAVMRHMSKMIDSVRCFNFQPHTKKAIEMVSVQGESVDTCDTHECEGPVEEWLKGCVDLMFRTIKDSIMEGYTTYVESPRNEWIMKKGYPCQTIVVASRIWFTQECEEAFAQLEDGNETALKDFFKQQEGQIRGLINMVLGKITSNERKMLVHLITIDVHARDVVGWMIEEKAETRDTFTWQSQLRYSWDDKRGSIIDICDASFVNGYEYIGLCGCLVITKLTDRCYITLSQALRLVKGGAPAGPAGTGKTETTKDLARNLGIACYVFNCSDQMDYLSLGQIFKGLSMSGSWGCFDEFNRIPIQVLSVVATQVSSILNAVKLQKKKFKFMDEEISLIPSVGMWITMNPGYAGRTELPENIKSLFRPCAMCVPDLKNICEIMLAAEGFQDAKDLALKFVTLYKLNKELLSPQAHYDWGLRAVKSVLYIAGALKRGDPDVSERAVLMRALRDTNMAKLSRDDVFVFMGLIRALFPALDVPPKSDPKLYEACKQAAEERKLLRGENEIFILRCVQYAELLDVRHSVFVMGPASCGKSQCWMTLARAFRIMGDPCDYKVMNPKAVTSDELYGYIHPQSREWKDGLLSNVFRDYAELSQTKTNSKWLVLDGIIDAEWIESMNTVMDDNRMLTLASNERIPLTASMRMIFEISNLKNASPATVSRAGIIYINDTDLGWGPYKDKWIATREDDKERTYLDNMFDKYVGHILEYYKRVMKPPVAIIDLSLVQTVTRLLDALLTPDNMPPGSPSEHYEKYFLFSLVWAFGGPLSSDGRVDYRVSFSNWWKKEFPAIRLTQDDKQSIFDTFIPDGSEDKEFVPWSTIVPQYKHNFDMPFADISIDTVDTTRLSFLMGNLMKSRCPVIFVGTAGTGKSNIILKQLNSLEAQDWVHQTIAFNAMTQPKGLQLVMEQKLEKKHGKTFGPPGKKRLVYFVDDLNMPNPDNYGTQEAIAFLRQHFDYQFWYDRIKPGFPLKEIASCQYLAAMNPKSGTFTVLDRLLWHFSMFSCSMPDESDLQLIYGSIMKGHWGKWSKDSRAMAEPVTAATVKLHRAVSKAFLPTAIKFHYQWNMREMFNIFQGMCRSVQKEHDKPTGLVRLWVHECSRTFRDRLTDEHDLETYDGLLATTLGSSFGDIKMEDVVKSPGDVDLNMWAPFGVDKDGNEGVMKDMASFDECYKFLNAKLMEYNDNNIRMDLVLFEQAMQHICRICRVLANPRGNALLVGVGGSGKQSLSRLSSFICALDKFQIVVTATYNINDFRADLQQLYVKCGQKNNQFTFIITDGQIVKKEMLVYLNDLLNSGNIPDLFPPDEMEGIQGSMVNEAKALGVVDLSPAVLWQFFINKVRANLHTILCFSPVGQQFSTWCRQFPALANTTVIDWFHPWPEQALISVAMRFLSDVELEENNEAIANHMAFCHEKVTDACRDFLSEEKRYCYTTPKSFLELISLYKVLLNKKRSALNDNKERLGNGIEKIKMASSQVADLQEKLKKEQVVVAEKAQYTQRLLEHVGKEKAIVAVEQEKAEIEETKTNKVFVEAEALAADCARDLQAAQPIVEEALAALNSLKKEDLTELKALAKPPADVELVAAAVMVLISDPKKIPPLKGGRDWSACKKMMANITGWMKDLLAFDANNIPPPCIEAIKMYIDDAAFDPVTVKTKSQAAAGLCGWVVNINKYHHIRCEVKPKEEKLAESQERLTRSKGDLKKVQDRVAELNAKLAGLVKQFEEASEETRLIETKAKKTQEKANLAERLVGGLADEKVRWAKTIDELSEKSILLIGDVLLSAAFVSYIGPFSKPFRTSIMETHLTPDIAAKKIPHTKDLDVVTNILTSDAEVAGWQNEELKSDRLSIENGALVVNCTRWPLLIDPQMQGIKWIKTREEKNNLQICQPTQKKYIDIVVKCLEEGLPCLIENLGEQIDPILEPVLGRNVIKKGSQYMMKLGDKEVSYHQNFKLYLQTRLNNPHYKPEMNAQSTLINFMVTPEGLEDQLLAVVVNKERPDLEESRVTLLRRMNQMTIDLQSCEQNLLEALAAATGDILENVALIENLEFTKKKAAEISRSMIEAKLTQKEIGVSRLSYTTVAVRGSLLFFQIDQLAKISHMYQYSLTAYMVIFLKAIGRAPYPEDAKNLQARCDNLITSITQTIFAFTSRGLFERHKLIFSALLCFAILQREGRIDRNQLNYLLRGTKKPGVERPESVESWLPEANWQGVQALKEVEGASPPFEQLERDICDSNRWKAWCELEHPEHKEEGRMPTDWKNLTDFQRLLVLRALRPDRLTVGLTDFVAGSIGSYFVEDMAVPLNVSFEDATPVTPVFFILSPGVDPVAFVVALGKQFGFTEDQEKLFNVSLGQGQEPRAFHALETSFENGGWAMLNNIHLVSKFCKDLEKRLDTYEEVYIKMESWERRRRERRLAKKKAVTQEALLDDGGGDEGEPREEEEEPVSPGSQKSGDGGGGGGGGAAAAAAAEGGSEGE